MKAKSLALAALTGVIFAVGLALSGMTDPKKVLGFLDVAHDWDPSLAFVMIGAIGVHLTMSRWILKRPAPLFEPSFDVPKKRAIDARLVVGAALFGIGWGTSGVCPGPAIVDVGSFGAGIAAFVGAMIVGMLVFRVLFEKRLAEDAQTDA